MTVNRLYCFSANRICHHDDYYLLVDKIRPSLNVKKKGEKLRALLGRSPIVFFDIDSLDLIYFPIILIRGLWGGNGLAISVRTEYLLEKRTIIQFLFHIQWKTTIQQFRLRFATTLTGNKNKASNSMAIANVPTQKKLL